MGPRTDYCTPWVRGYGGVVWAAGCSAESKYQSEGLTERINEPPWGRCLQGAVDVRWVVVVVVVVVVASQGGHFGLIVLRHTASLFCHQRGSQSSYGALVNGI